VLILSHNVEYFAKKLVDTFGGLDGTLAWSTTADGTILGHCFFPDVLNKPLEKLLETDTDTGRIKKYVSFIEDMYANGDDDVKNIVEVSLLEYHALGYGDRLKNLYKYLSPTLQSITMQLKNGTHYKRRK